MKIKALVAAILTAAAAPSFALVVGQETPAQLALPLIELSGSGATAIDKQLKFLVSENLCETGSVTFYTDQTSKPEGNKYSAYYCITNGTLIGAITGDSSTPRSRLLIHKNSNGGSFNGVGPVAKAEIEDQMSLTAGCNDSGTTDSVTGGKIFQCSPVTVDNTKVVEFGVSDVEPGLWAKLGQPFPEANLDSEAMNGNTFGIPVTLGLRDALQAAQGLSPIGDTGPVPTLSRAQVASLLQGTVAKWTQFTVNGNALTSFGTPVNTRVQVCRRVDSSGTMAQANVFFNNFPCGSGEKAAKDNTSFSLPANGTTVGLNLNPAPTAAAVIHEFDGSGGVTDCLDTLQTANAWAIGIQSTEKKSNKWRFVKIDGQLPTLKSVANNSYGDWYSSAMTWRSPTTTLGTPPSTDKLAVLKAMRKGAGAPAILARINQSFSQVPFAAAGEVGLVALPYRATDKVFSTLNPVATASREGRTGTVPADSCKTPLIFGNSEI